MEAVFISECSGNQRPCLAEKKDELEAKPPKFRVPSFGPSPNHPFGAPVLTIK